MNHCYVLQGDYLEKLCYGMHDSCDGNFMTE